MISPLRRFGQAASRCRTRTWLALFGSLPSPRCRHADFGSSWYGRQGLWVAWMAWNLPRGFWPQNCPLPGGCVWRTHSTHSTHPKASTTSLPASRKAQRTHVLCHMFIFAPLITEGAWHSARLVGVRTSRRGPLPCSLIVLWPLALVAPPWSTLVVPTLLSRTPQNSGCTTPVMHLCANRRPEIVF